MTLIPYLLKRANAFAYIGIPACLFAWHGMQGHSLTLGSYCLLGFWYVIPLGQIWGYQAKIALAELSLANFELENLTLMYRRLNHDRTCA